MYKVILIFAAIILTSLCVGISSAQIPGRVKSTRRLTVPTGSGDDQLRSSRSQRRRGRTETVDNNETITVHGGRSRNLVQGNLIGVGKASSSQRKPVTVGNAQNVTVGGVRTRPKRLAGDYNADGHVDGRDLVRRRSRPGNSRRLKSARRQKDETHTVGHDKVRRGH